MEPWPNRYDMFGNVTEHVVEEGRNQIGSAAVGLGA